MTHGPHPDRRDRAEPLADPARATSGGSAVRKAIIGVVGAAALIVAVAAPSFAGRTAPTAYQLSGACTDRTGGLPMSINVVDVSKSYRDHDCGVQERHLRQGHPRVHHHRYQLIDSH
jgi:hypothetical protein